MELRDIFLDVASTPPGQEGQSIAASRRMGLTVELRRIQLRPEENCRWLSTREYRTLLLFVRSMLDFPLSYRSISSLKPVNVCHPGESS